jgi:hypothetical protein
MGQTSGTLQSIWHTHEPLQVQLNDSPVDHPVQGTHVHKVGMLLLVEKGYSMHSMYDSVSLDLYMQHAGSCLRETIAAGLPSGPVYLQ